jgi:hypothetical protein
MYVPKYVATVGATNCTIHTTRIHAQDGQNSNYYRTPPRRLIKNLLFHINCSVLYSKLLVLCSLDLSPTI